MQSDDACACFDFRLHFGVILGAKFATIVTLGAIVAPFGCVFLYFLFSRFWVRKAFRGEGLGRGINIAVRRDLAPAEDSVFREFPERLLGKTQRNY